MGPDGQRRPQGAGCAWGPVAPALAEIPHPPPHPPTHPCSWDYIHKRPPGYASQARFVGSEGSKNASMVSLAVSDMPPLAPAPPRAV